MSLDRRPQEESVGVAFAKTLLIIATVTFLGWLFTKPGADGCGTAPAAAADAGSDSTRPP